VSTAHRVPRALSRIVDEYVDNEGDNCVRHTYDNRTGSAYTRLSRTDVPLEDSMKRRVKRTPPIRPPDDTYRPPDRPPPEEDECETDDDKERRDQRAG
jgi:hypothetical protein